MNNDVKVTLTITGIPGRTRTYTGKKKVKTVLQIKKNKKVIYKEICYKVPTFEYKPTSKRINLNQAFFDYATSSECPDWFSNYRMRKDLIRKWEKMTWKERLEMHFLRMQVDNHGTGYIYNVFED